MALKVEKFFCLSLPNATLTIGFLTIVCGLFEVFILVEKLNDDNFRQYDITHNGGAMAIIEWLIFGNSLVILSGLLLIIGTVKKSHLLFLPWLVMTAPALILGIGMIYFLISETLVNGMMLIFLSSVGGLFLTVFQIYMWIAVFSFSCEIREEKNRERRVQYDSQPESANTADEECNPKHAFQRI